MKLCGKFFHLLLLSKVLLFVSVHAFAENTCIQTKHPGYVVGYGEAPSFNEAKESAIVDAASYLGMKLNVLDETTDIGINGGTLVTRSLEKEVLSTVRGAQVLEQCNKGTNVQVVVGIRTSIVSSLIERRCESRNHWLAEKMSFLQSAKKINPGSMSQIKAEIERLKREENEDLDVWIVLGKPRQLFDSLSKHGLKVVIKLLDSKSQKDKKDISIIARDSLAQRTLDDLTSLLENSGYSVTLAKQDSENSYNWSCSISKGSPVGGTIRFVAQCRVLQSNLVEPIQVQGISTADSLEDTAARVVRERLIAH